MKHVFMDTNVVIDFLTNRQPFALDAAKLFDMAVKEKIKIYISALSYGNIHYVVKRSFGNNMAISLLNELAEMTEIVDVTKSIIRQSLKTDFKDYEDAIQYYCALSIKDISLIITRDTNDFKKSTLSVLTPFEAIASIKSD
ncbi:PIN domain-containing protein [Mucilaginibacter sp.]|uniref:type II toxin-antitoxin system VapC family toxin n=1 Tax=Mucilaginibacter sp. TaxID=1882438 RepID=UPI003263152C